jgi:hypothetical protein
MPLTAEYATPATAQDEGLPHKHEHRLDEDAIKPRDWST